MSLYFPYCNIYCQYSVNIKLSLLGNIIWKITNIWYGKKQINWYIDNKCLLGISLTCVETNSGLLLCGLPSCQLLLLQMRSTCEELCEHQPPAVYQQDADDCRMIFFLFKTQQLIGHDRNPHRYTLLQISVITTANQISGSTHIFHNTQGHPSDILFSWPCFSASHGRWKTPWPDHGWPN